jgi:GAF domain-containing protein/tetratricopeptide (TPR) repeat protein
MLQGDYSTAYNALFQAIQIDSNEDAAATLLTRLGLVCKQLGRPRDALNFLRRGVLGLGDTPAPTKYRLWRDFAWQLAVSFVPSGIKSWFRSTKRLGESPDRKEIIYFLPFLAELEYQMNARMLAGLLLLRHLNLAEAGQHRSLMGMAYAYQGFFAALCGWSGRAQLFQHKSKQIWQNLLPFSIDNAYLLWVRAYANHLLGIQFLLAGEFLKASATFEEAILFFQKINEKNLIFQTQSYLGFTYRYQSDFDKSRKIFALIHEKFRTGQSYLDRDESCLAQAVIWAVQGETKEAQRLFAQHRYEEEASTSLNVLAQVRLDYLESFYQAMQRLLHRHKAAETLPFLDHCLNLSQQYTIDLLPFPQELEILRLIVQIFLAIPVEDEDMSWEKMWQIHRLRRRCRKVFRSSRRMPLCLGLAHVMMGLFHIFLGIERTGLRYLQRSLEIFSEMEMKFELAGANFLIGEYIQKNIEPHENATYFQKALDLFDEVNASNLADTLWKYVQGKGIILQRQKNEQEKIKDRHIDTILLKVNQRITNIDDMDTFLRAALDELMTVNRARLGLILDFQEPAQKFRILSARNWEKHELANNRNFEIQYQQLIREIEQQIHKEIGSYSPSHRLRQIKSSIRRILWDGRILWAPIIFSNRLKGAIIIENFVYNLFQHQDIERLEKFANFIATSLELIHILQIKDKQINLQNTAEELSFHLASRSVGRLDSMNELLRILLGRLSYDMASIFLPRHYALILEGKKTAPPGQDTLECVALQRHPRLAKSSVEGHWPEHIQHLKISLNDIALQPDQTGLFGRTYHDQTTRFSQKFEFQGKKKVRISFTPEEQAFFEKEQPTSIILTPIVFEKEPLGLLYVDMKNPDTPLTDLDAVVLQSFAWNLAVAIKQVEARLALEQRYEILLAKISHDIRNPLSLAKDFLGNASQLIEERERSGEMSLELHDEIWRSLAMLDMSIEISKNLVEESKMSSRQLVLAPMNFDLLALVRQTLEMILALEKIYAKGILIDFQPRLAPCDSEQLIMLGDKTRVAQVKLNILQNDNKI